MSALGGVAEDRVHGVARTIVVIPVVIIFLVVLLFPDDPADDSVERVLQRAQEKELDEAQHEQTHVQGVVHGPRDIRSAEMLDSTPDEHGDGQEQID